MFTTKALRKSKVESKNEKDKIATEDAESTARPAAGTKKKNRNYGKHGMRGKNKISTLTSSVISATSAVV